MHKFIWHCPGQTHKFRLYGDWVIQNNSNVCNCKAASSQRHLVTANHEYFVNVSVHKVFLFPFLSISLSTHKDILEHSLGLKIPKRKQLEEKYRRTTFGIQGKKAEKEIKAIYIALVQYIPEAWYLPPTPPVIESSSFATCMSWPLKRSMQD